MSEDRSNPLSKIKTYIELIDKLRTRGMTRKDIKFFLSKEKEIGDKTVQRRIADLKKSFGKQFTQDGYGKYRLELCNLPDSITEQDINAVDIAIKKVDSDETLKQTLQNLQDKLSTKLHRYLTMLNPTKGDKEYTNIKDKIEQIKFVHVGPQAKINIDKHVLDILSDAIFNQQRISFKYYRYNSDETFEVSNVCPLGFLYGPNNKYCIIARFAEDGFADLSSIVKYKLEQISNVSVSSGKLFRISGDFSIENYANSMFGVYSEDRVYDIEWFVPHGDITKEILRYTFHPTQTITQHKDGSLTIKFHCGGLKHIAKYLTQWEGKIIPVAPQELLDACRNLLNTCLSSIDTNGKTLNLHNKDDDALYEQAKQIVVRDKNTTISHLQKEMGIGKVVALIERMERDGIVSAADADYKRRVL